MTSRSFRYNNNRLVSFPYSVASISYRDIHCKCITVKTLSERFWTDGLRFPNLIYPVSSVMTSPGETMCFGSNPTKDSIFFLFLGNLTSTDMFSDEMNLHT